MATSADVRRRTAASEAWQLIRELAYGQRALFQAMAAEFELSPPQIWALMRLERDEAIAMSKLAEALACDNSNVTGLIDRLEQRGLVKRQAAERDRRVRMLVLTGEGVELRDRLRERINTPPPQLTGLSAVDQRALRDIMRRALER